MESPESTSSSKTTSNQFKLYRDFTMVPNLMIEYLVGSSLPNSAKLLILLIHRYSFGVRNYSVYLKTSELKKVLPTHHSNIPLLVKWLKEFNIIKGGPSKLSKNKKVMMYELSLNYRVAEWDVSFRGNKRTALNDILDRSLRIYKDGKNELEG